MARRANDNPLVAVFMLVLLLGAAGGAIWISVREKATGERRYASPDTILPGPLAQAPGSGTPNSPRFVESFKQLPKNATALQEAADSEWDSAARLIGANELPQVQRLMSRGGGRDDYSDSELALLRRHGLSSWVRAKAVKWSQDDPSFNTAAQAVWDRSPKAKNDAELTELAVKWGEMDRAARMKMLQIIHAVEVKSRELSDGERDAVVKFAGEEYLNNRQ